MVKECENSQTGGRGSATWEFFPHFLTMSLSSGFTTWTWSIAGASLCDQAPSIPMFCSHSTVALKKWQIQQQDNHGHKTQGLMTERSLSYNALINFGFWSHFQSENRTKSEACKWLWRCCPCDYVFFSFICEVVIEANTERSFAIKLVVWTRQSFGSACDTLRPNFGRKFSNCFQQETWILVEYALNSSRIACLAILVFKLFLMNWIQFYSICVVCLPAAQFGDSAYFAKE